MFRSLLIYILLFSFELIMAQEWSKEDSLWLHNVLEGKEELIINEDTRKVIEGGRVILPAWLRDNDPNAILELNKELDEAGIPDSLRIRRLNPYAMPPAVFALYVLYIERMDSAFQIKSLIITDDDRKQLEALLPAGVGAFYPYTLNLNPGFTLGGNDFNHMLSMVFSAQYRRLAYNRKHATAYKNYYDNGVERPIRITDHERKQLNRAVNSARPKIRLSIDNRIGGIDN